MIAPHDLQQMVIVGNGTPPPPGVIDSFGYVARINRFSLGGAWGHRLDCHISPVWPAYVRRFARFPRHVWLVPDVRPGLATRTTPQMVEQSISYAMAHGAKSVEVVSEVDVAAARAWCRGAHPTTGLTIAVALTAAVNRFGLSLAGFDLAFSGDVKLMSSHDAKSEHAAFQALGRAGHIRFRGHSHV